MDAEGAKSMIPPHVQNLIKLGMTFAIAGFGTVFTGMIVSVNMAGGGMSAVYGCIAGFFVFFFIGGLATGFWTDITSVVLGKTKEALVPHEIAMAFGQHGNFDMVVTIHSVECDVQGQLPWQSRSLFIEVECGNNPKKGTCVSPDGIFNETFKMQIKHSDECVVFKIKNQDIFGARNVGFVYVPTQDLINSRQPWPRQYDITAGHADWLRAGGASSNKLSLTFSNVGAIAEQDRLRSAMKSQTYGATHNELLDALPDLEFNQTVKVPKHQQAGNPYATRR
jgi:hypothetical protein|mmetsp:Transcript_34030/g.101081  ORF Transcript_34030/g.101081 Transcript_34030/m.101081 type:complete len:280 (+) Transcript_34030:146-985(+)